MGDDFGVNVGLVEELYLRWLEDPSAVDASFRAVFDARSARSGPPAGRPSLAPPPSEHALSTAVAQARLSRLVEAYRAHGHLAAAIDPLGRAPAPSRAGLELGRFGFSEADLNRTFSPPQVAGPPVQTLRDIIARLRDTYCRTIGVEFAFLDDAAHRAWLVNRMESTNNRPRLDEEAHRRMLTKLTEAETLEQFIHKSYAAGTKRFSLEGAESLIPLLNLVIEKASDVGVNEVVLGMAHRGRLNVLVNLLGQPANEIFVMFEDADAERWLGRGDVKYHLGFSTDRRCRSGRNVHLTLTFNPSHLEYVNPVVEGRTRAKQDRFGDAAHRRAVALQIHGDAAMIGQGIVAETLNLAALDGYTTGGTIHVIVNNQIGFTTNPEESRSTLYASDIGQMLSSPIFHVNGEDPEAVAQVAELAVEFRQRFGRSVVIDLYCYRRYGHNEGDEPRFTQPVMYAAIDRKPTVRQTYVQRLVDLGLVDIATADAIVASCRASLAAALDDVRERHPEPVTYSGGGIWARYRGGDDRDTEEVDTGVEASKLLELSRRITTVASDFDAHPKIRMFLRDRHERLASGAPCEWGAIEALAYATLLDEGAPIRLSGHEAQRGAFNHRHAVLHDQSTGARFTPLATLGRFEAINDPASAAGTLGFQFGYSLDFPEALVVWEAHFGDLVNAAQVIVDQFVTSSEDKWKRLSGLVIYLPHGYEGQGPEQSTGRIERFCQNAAEDNVQLVNPTTPAQLFHVLRRQIRRPWRKPLIVFTPKAMLHVKNALPAAYQCTSTLGDLTHGRFQRVIGDADVGRSIDPASIKRVLLCTGKVYYDLRRARDLRGRVDVAIVRLEQLYPLNHELDAALAPYKNGTPVVWVQEEPWNFGAWYYVNTSVRDRIGPRFPLTCASRPRSASPATGSTASHALEQAMLVDAAFES